MLATSSSTIFHSSPRLRRSVSHASASSSIAAACRKPACSRPSAWPPAPAQISTAVSWATMSSRLNSARRARARRFPTPLAPSWLRWRAHDYRHRDPAGWEPLSVTRSHTAIVTGANHGIGAATAQALARDGCAVLCTFLRIDDPVDPGIPQTYRERRAQEAEPVAEAIRAAGGRAVAAEADLSDPATPATLFDLAEEHLGPVDVLINNATGWLADTFAPV